MMKSQAAMEYLMTYGWAILVIAVVLAALYSLGIFNPNTFTPKASAGSCEVVRPFGPTTKTDVHLEGTCTNMLPKYVASFNGKNSQISLKFPSNTIPANTPITVTMWINYKSVIGEGAGCGDGQIDLLDLSGVKFYLGYGTLPNGPTPLTFWIYNYGANSPFELYNNRWYFVAGTYSSQNHIIYVNQGLGSSSDPTTSQINGGLIGGSDGCGGTLNGSIANIQIYNKALSANQISALYQEGIGGDPINLNNLVAWYPLNGNANDYSGNKYKGKEYNVGYPSTWYRTYSAP